MNKQNLQTTNFKEQWKNAFGKTNIEANIYIYIYIVANFIKLHKILYNPQCF
jgi:hypothetical protein